MSSGHGAPPADQVGIEPCARDEDGRGQRLAVLRDKLLVVLVDDLLGIALDDLRRVRAAAVEQDLDLRGPGGRQIAGEILADLEDENGVPRVERGARRRIACDRQHAGEIGRACEACDEFARLGSKVAVEHRHADVLHLLGHREGEDQKLRDRRHDENCAAPRVAPHGEEFLDDQEEDAPRHDQSSRRRMTRATAMSSTAAIAVMASAFGTSTAETSPTRKSVCKLGTKYRAGSA